MWLLGVFSILYTAVQGIKESLEPTIPAENWENKDLHHQDVMNGVPMKQIIKNAQNGKYRYSIKYAKPHRDPTSNKVIIENCELHNADIQQYGAATAYKWLDQGKYNLNAEELKIMHLQYEKKRLEMYKRIGTLTAEETARLEEVIKILASINWDCRKTEAVLQWQRAHSANGGY